MSEPSLSFYDRLAQLHGGAEPKNAASEPTNAPFSAALPNRGIDKYAELRKQIMASVIDQVNDLAMQGGSDVNLQSIITDAVNRCGADIPRSDRVRLVQEVLHEVDGLGPLEELMADPSVTEIMVNGPSQVYVERRGKLELSEVCFENDAHVMKIIDRIVSRVGRRCDEANPMVDARLQDGSRVNAVIRPIALCGPTLTIRRFNSSPLQAGDLVRGGSMSYSMASFLEACIKGRCNAIVAGGTGSGKTTLLNVLSGYIPETERIVTIEDAAELQLNQSHVVTLESRPANIEGAGAITIRDLVRNALRMRPDRIIVGEVRSGETLDMLQAMNTGHEGSLTTVHANSPRDVISRLETMVLMSGMELPVRAIRDQISSAIDLIVQQARFRDGSRKIVSISEVLGMEGDTITLQDIFVFKPAGVDAQGKICGKHVATGIHPKILTKLKENGILVRDEWFAS